jgi:hypothetical protein
MKSIIDFLCGEQPLKGVWFGAGRPQRPGHVFWWRKELREAWFAVEQQIALLKERHANQVSVIQQLQNELEAAERAQHLPDEVAIASALTRIAQRADALGLKAELVQLLDPARGWVIRIR